MARRLALFLLLLSALAAVLPPGPPRWEQQLPSSWGEISARVEWLRSLEGRRIVILGDSVLASPHLTPSERPVQRMSALARSGQATIVDWSWPGFLPADGDVIQAQVAADPALAEIEWVVQLSTRQFSSLHIGAHSAPFLGEERPWWWTLPGAGPWNRRTSALRENRLGLAAVRGRMLERLSQIGAGLGFGTAAGDEERRAAEALRLAPHLVEVNAGPEAIQARAVGSLCARGARFVLAAIAEGRHGFDSGVVGEARAAVGAAVPPQCSLWDLRSPELDPSLFVDPLHLNPEGAEVLARSLLQAIGIDSAVPGPLPLEPSALDGVIRWVAGHPEPGHRDGFGSEARFRGARDLALGLDGRWFVADQGNHVVREVDVGRRSVRTVLGLPGKPGHADGPEERLDTPGRVVVDAEGGLWVLDLRGALRHLPAAGTVETVEPWTGAEPIRAPVLSPGRAGVLVGDSKDGTILRLRKGQAAELVLRGGPFRAMAEAADGKLLLADAEGCLHLVEPWAWEGRTFVAAASPPVVPCGAEAAATFWRATGDPLDLGPQPLEQVALAPVQRIFAVDADGTFVVEDTAAGVRALWALDLQHKQAWPFWPASRDGLRFSAAELYDGAVPSVGRDGEIGWLLPRHGLLVRWDPRVRSARWFYEKGGPVDRRGPGPAVRIAFFGSSLPGAARGGFESHWASLPARLDERLDREAGIVSSPVEIVPRCTPGQRLIHSVTGLRGQAEGSVDAAVLTLDRSTFLELVESARRATWDEHRQPVASQEGAVPKPVWGGEGLGVPQTDGERALVIRTLLQAWVAECRRRGIPSVVLNLVPLDDGRHHGLSAPRLDDPEIDLVAGELARLGVPLWDLRDTVAARLPTQWPINLREDHHFVARGMDLVIDATMPLLVPWIRGLGRAPTATAPASSASVEVRSPDPRLDRWAVPAASIATWSAQGRAGLTIDVGAFADDQEGLARRAMWALLATHGRLTPDLPVDIRLVAARSRDEYGQARGASSEVLARFRIEAADRARIAELEEALLTTGMLRPGWFRVD